MYVSNTEVLDHAAQLLGIPTETQPGPDVHKDLYTSLLDNEQGTAQCNHLVRNLYVILFTFVVETANYKIARGSGGAPLPRRSSSLTSRGARPVGHPAQGRRRSHGACHSCLRSGRTAPTSSASNSQTSGAVVYPAQHVRGRGGVQQLDDGGWCGNPCDPDDG